MLDLFNFEKNIDKYNSLLLDMYKGVEDGYTFFQGYLKKLQEVFYFDYGNIVFFRKEEKGYELDYFCQIGWEKEIEEAYVSTYYAEDDVFPIFGKKTFVVMRSSDMFDDSRTKTDYYQNFMVPAKFERSLECNIVLPKETNVYGICSLFRGPEKRDFTDEEKRLLAMIQPHLSQVCAEIRLTTHASYNNVDNSRYFSFRITIDEKWDVKYVSDNFDNIIQRYYSRGHYLNTIKNELKANVTNKQNGYFSIENTPFFVEFSARVAGNDKEYDCIVYDMSKLIEKRIARICEDKRLTQHETDILVSRLLGKSQNDIAEEMYLSVSGVKKHIGSIYNKMEVSSINQIFDKYNFIKIDRIKR